MNEIKRLQRLAGIDEIKINKPGSSFKVTPLGKKRVEEFITLLELAEIFEVKELLNDKGPENKIFRITQMLWIFSDMYGESIIKMNDNNLLEDYLNLYNNIWEEDYEESKIQLTDFMKLGYITKVNII